MPDGILWIPCNPYAACLLILFRTNLGKGEELNEEENENIANDDFPTFINLYIKYNFQEQDNPYLLTYYYQMQESHIPPTITIYKSAEEAPHAR